MGIAIEVDGLPTRTPYPLKITFECDARLSLLCRRDMPLSHSASYQEAHHTAIALGWLERNASNGRVWLCPECSGK